MHMHITYASCFVVKDWSYTNLIIDHISSCQPASQLMIICQPADDELPISWWTANQLMNCQPAETLPTSWWWTASQLMMNCHWAATELMMNCHWADDELPLSCCWVNILWYGQLIWTTTQLLSHIWIASQLMICGIYKFWTTSLWLIHYNKCPLAEVPVGKDACQVAWSQLENAVIFLILDHRVPWQIIHKVPF